MSWEAKPPPPTSPQLTVRPQWASPASSCFRRQECHPAKRSNVYFQLSKCILFLRHQFLINSSTFFYHRKQCSCSCFQKLLISITVYPAQSPKTVPAPMPSCWFIFAGMWLFVYNYVSADSWVGFAEKINKKDYFLTRRWSIEIGPEISLPPCILDSHRPFICSLECAGEAVPINRGCTSSKRGWLSIASRWIWTARRRARQSP